MRGGWLAWAGGNIDKQTLDLSIHLSAGMSASLFPYSKHSYTLYFHDICQFKPSRHLTHHTFKCSLLFSFPFTLWTQSMGSLDQRGHKQRYIFKTVFMQELLACVHLFHCCALGLQT